MNPLIVLGVAAGFPAVVQGAWHTALGIAALRRPSSTVPNAGEPRSLAILVPAHNEELMIGRTIESLLAAAHDGTEVIVIADNCDDGTPEIARALGATVLERQDLQFRGKNYALDFAIRLLGMRVDQPQVVAVVDADTVVSSNFASEVTNAIASGAQAVQVYYRAPASDLPLGRLRRLALALGHWSRPLGASRLGLGTSLKGNGMAFDWAIARDGIGGHGITEDAAFSLALAKRGVAIRFVPGAWVEGFMAEDYDAARVQDSRWERGRRGLMRDALVTALNRLLERDLATAAGALEVAALPLSVTASTSVAASGLLLLGGAPVLVASIPVALVAGSVVVGWSAARVSREDLSALATAPKFVSYKLGVMARDVASRGDRTWVRTSRN